MEKARRSITAVDQRIASNNAGKKNGTSEGNNVAIRGKVDSSQEVEGKPKRAGSENRSESQGGKAVMKVEVISRVPVQVLVPEKERQALT